MITDFQQEQEEIELQTIGLAKQLQVNLIDNFTDYYVYSYLFYFHIFWIYYVFIKRKKKKCKSNY